MRVGTGRGRHHDDRMDAVKTAVGNSRPVAAHATRGDATMVELRIGKGLHACGRDQPGRCRTMAAVAACCGGNVGRCQCAHACGKHAGEGAGSHRGAMAGGAADARPGMVEQGVGKVGAIGYRCRRHAGVGPHVAGLAAHAAHGDVAGVRCLDEVVGAAVQGGVGHTVALHAVGTGVLDIGVNGRQRGHNGKAARGVAGRAAGARGDRDVVTRLLHIGRIKRDAGVARRAFATARVGGIDHIERSGCGLRTGLKAEIARHGVQRHTDPGGIGVVASRTVAAHPHVNLGRAGQRRPLETTARHGGCGDRRHQAGRRIARVAVFAAGGTGYVRGGARTGGGRHHDGADTHETARRHVGPVAGGAAAGDAGVAEQRSREAGTVLHRQLQAASGLRVTSVTTLPIHTDMVARLRHKSGRHGVFRRVGLFVAGSASQACLRIGVNGADAGHQRVVAADVAGRAGNRRRGNVGQRNLGAGEQRRGVALVTGLALCQHGRMRGIRWVGHHAGMRIFGAVAIQAVQRHDVGMAEVERSIRKLRLTGLVAGLTGHSAGGDVVARHDGELGARVVPAMAGNAVLGCALEGAQGVAGFTAHILVLTVEHKAGAGVVKVGTTLLCLRQARGAELQQRKGQQGPADGQGAPAPGPD